MFVSNVKTCKQLNYYLLNKRLYLLKGMILCLQLPDKSMASLVRFYYSWKKTRSKMSLIDRQTRKPKQEKGDR